MLCVAALGACSAKESKAPKAVPIPEIEKRVGHHVLRPSDSLQAAIINSGSIASTGSTFSGLTAAVSYRWHDFVVLVRQGKPAEGFSLHDAVTRGDAIFVPKDANGVEVALLPSVGTTGAAAYRLQSGWLLTVDIAPTPAKVTPTLDELRSFVNSLG